MAATYFHQHVPKKWEPLHTSLFTITHWHRSLAPEKKMQVTAHYSLPKPLCCSASLSPSFFINSKTSLLPSHSLSFIYCKSLSTQLYGLRIKARQRRKVSPVSASTENNAERWLLEPIGQSYLLWCTYIFFFFFNMFISYGKPIGSFLFESLISLLFYLIFSWIGHWKKCSNSEPGRCKNELSGPLFLPKSDHFLQ